MVATILTGVSVIHTCFTLPHTSTINTTNYQFIHNDNKNKCYKNSHWLCDIINMQHFQPINFGS